jgi:hypothetical protein
MSIDYIIGEQYLHDELKPLKLVHFYTCRSIWTDGVDDYIFKHLPLKKLKFKFELEIIKDNKPVYTEFDYYNTKNCCNPIRLGIRR